MRGLAGWLELPRVLLVVLAVLVLGGVAATRASADEHDDDDFARPGLYMGASIAGMVPIYDEDAPGLNSETDGSYGYNLRVGYRATRHLAGEFQYERAQGFSTSGALSNGVARARLLTVNVKAVSPLEFPGHPYILAGIGAGQYWVRNTVLGISPLSGKQWEFAARFGIGVDYYVTSNIVVNLESTAIVSENKIFIERVPFVSISGGLQYRF